jgi:hypothetical protein
MSESMRESINVEFIEGFTGPITGKRYHVRCISILDLSNDVESREITIFDLNENPINANIKRVFTPNQYEQLKQNKTNMDKVINDIAEEMGI